MKKIKIAICWIRRDLRLYDNTALYKAYLTGLPVLPLFIFDSYILDKLQKGQEDKRINFILRALANMDENLRERDSGILYGIGSPQKIFHFLSNYNKSPVEIDSVHCNEDYEPYSIERDNSVSDILIKNNIKLFKYKDQVIFEKNDILKDNNTPYTIFTPYSKKWLDKLYSNPYQYLNINKPEKIIFLNNKTIRALSENQEDLIQYLPDEKFLGFAKSITNITIPYTIPSEIIKDYHINRNFPAKEGTSNASVHLRFGTLSIRELVSFAINAKKENMTNTSVTMSLDTWLKELIWREFFKAILYHFPHVEDEPFKVAYKFIRWRNNEEELQRWCDGNTGFPIVDAGMRELNKTGLMHNRVRMITSSFLTKHLLIDWRIGESYFAEKLLDYDLSSNNGNWQWAAGCGCDAAPYFRVFNPMLQSKKFDAKNQYISLWVPEANLAQYPKPVCDHAFARKRAIDTYKQSLKEG